MFLAAALQIPTTFCISQFAFHHLPTNHCHSQQQIINLRYRTQQLTILAVSTFRLTATMDFGSPINDLPTWELGDMPENFDEFEEWYKDKLNASVQAPPELTPPLTNPSSVDVSPSSGQSSLGHLQRAIDFVVFGATFFPAW